MSHCCLAERLSDDHDADDDGSVCVLHSMLCHWCKLTRLLLCTERCFVTFHAVSVTCYLLAFFATSTEVCYSMSVVHICHYIQMSCSSVVAVAGYSFTEHAAMPGFTWCQNALHCYSQCFMQDVIHY